MKVYLDLLFLLNFFFDFLLLLTVSLILKRNVKIGRIILGAIIGSGSFLFLFLNINSLELFLLKILTSILMLISAFNFKNIKYTLKNFLFLYVVSTLLGGFLYLLNIEFSYKNEGLIFYFDGLSINWIVLVILSPIILYIYIRQAKELKNNYANYYKVDIYLKDGTILKTNAFLDSGNKLVDPYKKRPIILIYSKKIKNIFEDPLLVPYDSINAHGLLKCIVPLKINIEGIGERKKVLVALSEEKFNMDGINCILHSRLLEGNK